MLAELVNRTGSRGHDVTVLMPPSGTVDFDVTAPIIRSKSDELTAEDYPHADVIVSGWYTSIPSAQKASENGKGVHVRLSLTYEPLAVTENHLSYPSYNVTDKVMVISGWHRQQIKLNHGIDARIVPPGVSDTFRNLQLRDAEPAGKKIFAVVRHVIPNHGWHRDQGYLIDQLKHVKRMCPDVSLNLICPPREFAISPELQRLRHGRLLRFFTKDTFRIHTPEDDEQLCRIHSSADIFVNASILETFCLNGLEAMRCGAALVTTYAGGNVDYCRHGINSLVSNRYENRLAKDIMALIEDHDLRGRLAQQGEDDSKPWTWDRSAQAFEDAVSEFLL